MKKPSGGTCGLAMWNIPRVGPVADASENGLGTSWERVQGPRRRRSGMWERGNQGTLGMEHLGNRWVMDDVVSCGVFIR